MLSALGEGRWRPVGCVHAPGHKIKTWASIQLATQGTAGRAADTKGVAPHKSLLPLPVQDFEKVEDLKKIVFVRETLRATWVEPAQESKTKQGLADSLTSVRNPANRTRA